MDITVVIPTYNRYSFLKKAISSVLEQTYSATEIVVVDDGSNDETFQIQNEFPQIKYIYQENKGVSAARNLGIQSAACEWIAFLDSDDTFAVDKLEKQVLFHKQNPELLISYTDEIWIRDNQEIKIPKKFQKIGKDIFLENLSYCNIAPSSVVVHKSLIKEIGLFDESLDVCEDYDLWLRIASRYKVGLLNEKLIYKYAGHDDQLSFKYWGMDRFRVDSLEKLLKTINNEEKKRKIEEELLKKYRVLLKGAIKYDKIHDILIYRKKIEQLEQRD